MTSDYSKVVTFVTLRDDLNSATFRYEPDELPTALPRDIYNWCRKPVELVMRITSHGILSRAFANSAIPALN